MAGNDINMDWSNFKLPDFQSVGNPNDTPAFNVPSLNWGGLSSPVASGLAPNSGTPSNWQSKWLGGTNENGTTNAGIIPTGINALTGLTSAYLGWKQMNLAQDQLQQNKKIFNLNFQQQANTVNRDLEDRQRARVASNPGAYESVGDYMNKNKVASKGI